LPPLTLTNNDKHDLAGCLRDTAARRPEADLLADFIDPVEYPTAEQLEMADLVRNYLDRDQRELEREKQRKP
jgi:hypothetical protein